MADISSAWPVGEIFLTKKTQGTSHVIQNILVQKLITLITDDFRTEQI